MKRLAKLLFLSLLLFVPLKEALALNCYLGTANGPVEQTKTIAPFSIPSNAQPGQKSGNLTILKFRCTAIATPRRTMQTKTFTRG